MLNLDAPAATPANSPPTTTTPTSTPPAAGSSNRPLSRVHSVRLVPDDDDNGVAPGSDTNAFTTVPASYTGDNPR